MEIQDAIKILYNLDKKEIEQYQYVNLYQADRLISKIYKEFERETCKNCKYFVECDDGYHYCNNINNTGLNGIITPDFCCNRFKKKGETND